jgi:hypothetical protein
VSKIAQLLLILCLLAVAGGCTAQRENRFITTAIDANELSRQTNSRGDVANRLNREQLSRASAPSAKYASSDAAAEPVEILFFRGDGGDPRELRVDAEDNLILIMQRNGLGRVYQNGRQIAMIRL